VIDLLENSNDSNGKLNPIVFGDAMFEKRTRLRVRALLERQFSNFRELEQVRPRMTLDKIKPIKFVFRFSP
jgi:hypothetical protein